MKNYLVRIDLVKATLVALDSTRSSLLEDFTKRIHPEDFNPPTMKIGESIHGNVGVNFDQKSLPKLIAELKAIESRVGYAAKFRGRQINLLVVAWTRLLDEMMRPESLAE